MRYHQLSETIMTVLGAVTLGLACDTGAECTNVCDGILDRQLCLPMLTEIFDDSSTNPRLLKPIPINDCWDLQFGGRAELRAEHRVNYLMQHPADGPTHDTPLSLYTQLNAALSNKDKSMTFFVEGLTVQTGNHEPMWYGYEDIEFDLFQAWLEYKFPNSPWSVKAGRQLASDLGDGRLISAPMHYWRYNSQDGITVRRVTPTMETTFLALMTNTFIGTDDYGNRYASEMRPANQIVWGIYNTWKLANKTQFDLYNLNKNSFNKEPYVSGSDGVDGRLGNYGFGSRIRGPLYEKKGLGVWAYGLEGMLQTGRYGGSSILAHMIHFDTSWEWDKNWKPKVTLFGNIASGNKDPYSNKWNRFDSLLGPSHYGYGLADVTRLSNMNELGVSFQVKPTKKTTVLTSAHQFWLNSAHDAWLAAGPGTLAWDKDGKSGRDLGQEIDLDIRYKVNEHWTMELGSAYFFTGDYGQQMGHGANSALVYLNQEFTF